MKVNKKGVTRIVLEFDNVVVKLPNFKYQWSHFLQGLLANIHESQTYKWCERNDLLAPVVWRSWGGWILIMKKADVKRHESEVYDDGRLFNYAEFINNGFGGDDKPANYGYYENRLVKIDYA